MQDISFILKNLSLNDDKNIVPVSYEEIGIAHIKNYNLMTEFYTHLSQFRNITSRGTLLSNKEVIIWLIKYNWIYNKIIEGILRVSINYSHDISANGLDKLTPNYFLDMLKINLSNEQFDLINQNFIYYNKLFQ